MIQIQCINCKVVSEVDDGFAGGVCRCFHCGTMQSVPKELKSEPPAPPAAPFETTPQATILAEVMPAATPIGAGSSVSGAAASVPVVNKRPPTGWIGSHFQYLLVGSAGLVVVMSVVVLWLIYGRESTVPTARAASGIARTDVATSTSSPPGTEVGGRFGRPAFCAVVVEEPTLVYLVDRSGLTPPALTAIKQSLSKSLDSLRSDQRFQIIFWNSEGEQNIVAIPAAGPKKATADVCAAAMAELLEPEGTAKATITESEDAPISAAIAQPDHSASTFSTKEDFSNNPGPPGQTFALKAGLILKAITVKGLANGTQPAAQGPFGRVTLTISQVERGGVLKRLRQESATGGFTSGAAYQTFTLAKFPLTYLRDASARGGRSWSSATPAAACRRRCSTTSSSRSSRAAARARGRGSA